MFSDVPLLGIEDLRILGSIASNDVELYLRPVSDNVILGLLHGEVSG